MLCRLRARELARLQSLAVMVAAVRRDNGISTFGETARFAREEGGIVHDPPVKLDKFALFAISAGAPAAIAYAVAHPEHVTHLVLCGTHADSDPGPVTPEERENREAGATLLRNGWGNPAIRGMFVSLAIPNGSEVDKTLFSEMLRVSTTPEDFGAFSGADDKIDVRSLAQQVRTPTLVLQVRGDELNPIHYSKELATLVPGARLVFIEGKDHIPVAGDGEAEQISQAVNPFIGESVH